MKKLILFTFIIFTLFSCGYESSKGDFYIRPTDDYNKPGEYITQDNYKDGLIFNKEKTNNFDPEKVIDILCIDILTHTDDWKMTQYDFINKNGVQIWIKDGPVQYYIKASKDYNQINFTEEERNKLNENIDIWKQKTKYIDNQSKSLINKLK